MPSTYEEILEWAKQLKYWEQACLCKILSGGPISSEDLDQLLRYLLQDAGLEEIPSDRPVLKFGHGPEIQETHEPVVLKRISNLININALVPGQELTFSEGITVVYGRNGSGKSGYARVLGAAGFTRGDREVLPNVSSPEHVDDELSADIEFSQGDKEFSIKYSVEYPCAELSSLYVFDSTSVQSHLSDSNPYSFSPAGLAILTKLAEVTDSVRNELDKRIDDAIIPHQFAPLFAGSSWVSDLVQMLGPSTSVDFLNQVADIPEKDFDLSKSLDIELAELKAQNVDERIRSLDQALSDLDALVQDLKNIADTCSDTRYSELSEILVASASLSGKIREQSRSSFLVEGLKHIGTEEWFKFISAARELATVEEEDGEEYPAGGSRCLLCHQELSNEAVQLIRSFWQFLRSETKLKFQQTKAALDQGLADLNQVDRAIYDDSKPAYRYIQGRDEDLHRAIIEYVGQALKRIDELVSLLRGEKIKELTSHSTSPIADIEKLKSDVASERTNLAVMKVSERILQIEDDLRVHEHRKVFRENIEGIVDYVSRVEWSSRAAKIKSSTAPITRKYNKLFRDLVTERYLSLFQGILEKLERPLHVKVVTTGKKASPLKKLALHYPDAEDYPPKKVLSEGEKRAVALADFLTEVALDISSSAVILDDPVTSLDLEWRDKIAEILVNEASNRQVVIFTHDLPFLYYVRKRSEEASLNFPIAFHMVVRGPDGKPGYIHRDYSPALEKDYKKATRAQECYELARSSVGQEQENHLRLGFAALRSTYESFIVFGLFGGVVNRFDEQIRFMNLQRLVWDRELVLAVQEKCEFLSRYIPGHLHSDTMGRQPTCELLSQEIEAFGNIRDRLKRIRAEVQEGDLAS
jgi:energy-coupling factor transporter ATP-binding protein EcfA2